jgi:hypothetical protein
VKKDFLTVAKITRSAAEPDHSQFPSARMATFDVVFNLTTSFGVKHMQAFGSG